MSGCKPASTNCTDRIEATLRQALRIAATQHEAPAELDANAAANLLLAFVVGRWHQFAKSGFKRSPLDLLDAQKRLSCVSPSPKAKIKQIVSAY